MEQFRQRRVTLLYGEPGDDTTELLKTRVLPALGRRSSDRKVAAGVAKQPGIMHDRREPGSGGPEIAIYCDTWNETTLETLRTRLASALIVRGARIDPPLAPLADSVLQWGGSLGARFMFVLDRFEHCVAAAPERPGLQAFVDEFVRMANEPGLPAHFLVAVPEYAEPMLQPLAERIEHFGDHSMRVPREEPAEAPAALPGDDMMAALGAPRTTTSPPNGATPTRDTSATSLAQLLRETQMLVGDAPAAAPTAERSSDDAGENRDAPMYEARPTETGAVVADASPAPDAAVVAPVVDETMPAPAPPSDVRPPIAADGLPTEPPRAAHTATDRPPRRSWLLALAASTVIAAVVAWSWWAPADAPDRALMRSSDGTSRGVAAVPRAPEPPSAPVAATAATAPAPASVPSEPVVAPDARHVRMAVDAGSTNSQIVRELQHALAPGVALDIDGAPDAAVREQATLPTLAIVTFETIRPPRGARAAAGSARDAFRIVAPLYTEEIHVVARRDSPLEFVHELQGKRVNFGPAQTGRRATATRLYERMFGAAVPVETGALDDAEALRRLVADRSLDAVIIVEAQPARRLTTLAPEIARGIKLLSLDRTHPTAQAAIEDYLPVKLRAASYPALLTQDAPSLATMAFLVAPRPADAQAVDDLTTVARGLCRQLATLQREGHPKWREVQPLLTLDGGWQLWPPVEAVFRSCQDDVAGPAVATNPSKPQRGAAR